MATKKNAAAIAADYEQAVEKFSAAVTLFQQGKYKDALAGFGGVIEFVTDEPVLAQRSLMYITVCKQRLAEPNVPSSTPDDLYYRAVIESNNGNSTEAIQLLDQALQQNPNSARMLYARACAWALAGDAESAVNDLRRAITADPTVRFQAVNDSDFERIREEPGFIDIIEPTPTGV